MNIPFSVEDKISTNKMYLLKDSELHNKVKNLAQQERRLLQILLEHIAEVDRRKLYLKMAYPSLYEYLTIGIGYSEGSAQRRIDAARLLQNIPQIAQKIHEGSLNLSQISKMQKFCRQSKKESGVAVPTQQQQKILQKLENQGTQQTDLILAQEFQIKIENHSRQTIQADQSVRVELTFSKEEMQLIQQAQQLLSHKTGSAELKDTFLELAHKLIRAAKPRETPIKSVQKESSKKSYISEKIIPSAATSALTSRLKKAILQRDQHCQFKDHKTGKICGSKFFLEVDHIQPRFAGGQNSRHNLRVLCQAHNQFRYTQGL